MDRETARQTVKANWREIIVNYTGIAQREVAGQETYICPFCGHGKHGDGIKDNPKSKDGNGIKCFGSCDFSGDIIDFIMRLNNTDYNTALKAAAADLGIEIDPYRASAAADFAETTPGGARNASQNAFSGAGHEIPGETEKTPTNAAQGLVQRGIADYTQYYMQCAQKLSSRAAISYLEARCISPETAAAYGLGYDPQWISPAAVRRLEAKGNDWRPPATERIIMPVSKNHYVARAISPDIKKEFAKMNETGGGSIGIFNTGAVYGSNEAVFLTEGVFDALSIIETGAAAVALNSTSNAEAFIKLLEERPTHATLVLCLDNDESGKKAAAALKQGLTRLNISYVTADICGRYNDPNDALVGDRAAFEKAIRDAEAQTAAKPDNMTEYIDSLMPGEIERLKAAADRKTGFTELDSKSGGLYPGLYVIAATSSLGKTTFALQLADNLAAAGHDVLFFSMEQSRLELVSKSFSRLLAQDQRIEVNSLALRKGSYPDKMQQAAAIYKEKIADHMSIIEGNFNCNISFIGEYIRRYIRRNGTSPIVFIDYLQILRPAEDARTSSVKETVDTTVTELKRISREHDLTVFVVSSVNRANYMTPIDFEALKESGGIEYTADVIWGLQLQCLNDPLFDKKEDVKKKRQKIREEKAANPRMIELLCLKNRYGIANFSCNFEYYPAKDLFTQEVGHDFAPDYGKSPFTGGKAAGTGQNVSASF